MAETIKRYKGAILLSMLVLTVTLIGGQAAAQELDAKGEKELAARGQQIDKSAAQADPGRVTAKIVDEWRGTKFKFDATSAPRELTAQDVQNLRAKGLGFGEVTKLLALTAKQPNSTTAKPLYEILAMRQSGTGWGKLARELGYKNLGEVMKSVKATEKGVTQVATERSEKPGKAGKPEKVEKLEKPEKMQRVEKPERPEKPGR